MGLALSQPPVGLQIERTVCTARNETGGATAIGDLVLFDVGGTASVPGTTSADSIDPNDENYIFGVVRPTPDKTAEAALNHIVSYGVYAIALEVIADGESGEFLVQGFVKANVLIEQGGSGAGTVGAELGAHETAGENHDVLHGAADMSTAHKILGRTLSAVTNEGAVELTWIMFDGIHGLGLAS